MFWILLLGLIAVVIWNWPRNTKSQPAPAALPTGSMAGTGNFKFEVVGESHYQGAIEHLAGGRTEDGVREQRTATLICDDNNDYDDQAVRVEINGRTVGHLSRVDARTYRRVLADEGRAGAIVSCPALIVGGWDRGDGDIGHFGVKLDLPLAKRARKNIT